MHFCHPKLNPSLEIVLNSNKDMALQDTAAIKHFTLRWTRHMFLLVQLLFYQTKRTERIDILQKGVGEKEKTGYNYRFFRSLFCVTMYHIQFALCSLTVIYFCNDFLLFGNKKSELRLYFFYPSSSSLQTLFPFSHF
jgi:hypothetical protein